jgi:hypothetical protein
MRAVLLLLGALAVPLTLIWDFAWESTIGVDAFFGPPHAANYAAVAVACAAALRMAQVATREGSGVALGPVRAPLGAWLTLWGGLALVAALLFDRWWQASYGLAAGIWHPPQIAKALAYFALVAGAWVYTLGRQHDVRGELAAALACGAVLLLIGVVTLPQSFANRQHSGAFYVLMCSVYPLVLAAQAVAGRLRLPATSAALAYLALCAAAVWLLPLIPGSPQAGPVYNPRDHLLPPPFPLLLVVPALAVDALLNLLPGRARRGERWMQAVEAGLAFAALFVVAQWVFAAFLLSPSADGWLFAGGGRHWPFFLRIDASMRTAFWHPLAPELGPASSALAAALAVASARAGLWLGAGLRAVQR